MAVTEDDRRMEVISKCLNYMCNQVDIENAIRRHNINSSMENFYAGVLNIVWECNLINCNLFDKNHESFDLSDTDRYIAVQVTSTNTSVKIDHTIETFNKNAYYEQYYKLYMYIITSKARHTKKFDPGHNVEFQIWDAADLMKEIERKPIACQKKLYEYFREKIPEAVALFERDATISVEKSKIQFDRTVMAFWMNPYAADDEQWYEDRYQIALADYLITMGKNGLYLLIDLFEKDLAYTLNCHAEELGVSHRWTEQGEADTGKVIYFQMEDKASVSRIVSEVGKWKDAQEPYQLLINFSAGDTIEIFRIVMRVAREISEKWPSVVPEILSLVNPYKSDFMTMDLPEVKRWEQSVENSVNMWSHRSYIYTLLHDNVSTFSGLCKAWLKGTDDQKYDLIEFSSHSKTAAGMVLKELAADELERLLSDEQLLYREVDWDEIIITLVQMNLCLDCMAYDSVDALLQKGSDGCRAFLQSKKPITREDWNELIGQAAPDDYERYMNEIPYLGKAERLKLIYGCAYGEKERASIIADQRLLDSYQRILLRKDMDTEYLFPQFIGGLERCC